MDAGDYRQQKESLCCSSPNEKLILKKLQQTRNQTTQSVTAKTEGGMADTLLKTKGKTGT